MLKEYAVQMAKADLLDPLVTFVFFFSLPCYFHFSLPCFFSKTTPLMCVASRVANLCN
jgi:hypothetical protein